MLDVVLLSAIVLQAATVNVIPARVRFVTSESRLHQLCGVEGNLDACSRLVAYRLTANCQNNTEGWRISAAAQFMPLVYLIESQSMAHENDHIDDIRNSVDQHLRELERRIFSTAGVCEDVADRARAGFGARIHRFARESQKKRDPSANIRFLSATDR